MIVSSLAAAALASALLAVPSWSVARQRLLRAPGAGGTRHAWRQRAGFGSGRDLRPAAAGTLAGVLTALIAGWPHGVVLAVPFGALSALGTRRLLAARANNATVDELRLAAGWDLLAACLRSGQPVPVAVRAVAADAPGAAAAALLATADLLALGAEPGDAWAPARACPATAELARTACRSARSGIALAGAAETMAARVRAGMADRAEARAQRAGVLITGPLGLCFLPAFLCLGVIPVVLGLASQLTVLR